MWGAGMTQWTEGLSPINVAQVRSRRGTICGLSLLLVLALLREFFSRFSGFPPSRQTPTLQLDHDRGLT